MRFITCINESKLDEVIEIMTLKNNLLFDFNRGQLNSCKSLVKNLNGDCNSLVIGTCVDDNSGDLSKIWSEVSKLLPAKTGDIIMQFNINSDECLFYEFNEFMDSLYNDRENLQDLVSYDVLNKAIVVSSEINANTFDCAFIVNSDWGKGDFNTIKGGGILTSFQDLEVSKVWRN